MSHHDVRMPMRIGPYRVRTATAFPGCNVQTDRRLCGPFLTETLCSAWLYEDIRMFIGKQKQQCDSKGLKPYFRLNNQGRIAEEVKLKLRTQYQKSARSRNSRQGCGFNPWSGHVQESTSECINKWNDISMFLLSPFPSLSKVNRSKRTHGQRQWEGGLHVGWENGR